MARVEDNVQRLLPPQRDIELTGLAVLERATWLALLLVADFTGIALHFLPAILQNRQP